MECAICFESVCDGRRLACDHTFHIGCIDTWLTKSRTCPMCRAAVPVADAELAEYVEATTVLPFSAVMNRCMRLIREYKNAADPQEKEFKRELIMRLVGRHHLDYDNRIVGVLVSNGITVA